MAEGRETTANDRPAGRWCEICQQHGSHHTDRHDLFVTAGRRATPGPCPSCGATEDGCLGAILHGRDGDPCCAGCDHPESPPARETST